MRVRRIASARRSARHRNGGFEAPRELKHNGNGEVQFIPTAALNSSFFTGHPATIATAGDLATFWASNSSSYEYLGIDLSAVAPVTHYRFTPRPDQSGGASFDARQIGAQLQSAAASSFASPTTLDTIRSYPFAPRYQLDAGVGACARGQP